MNENGDFILKNEEIANTFNNYFGAIVDNLGLHHWEDKTSPPSNTPDKINDIIKNYEKHPSICNIKTIYRGIETAYFPDSLKLATVVPVFKKEDTLDKSNYRQVSILPLLSKVYEQVI